MAFDIQSLRVNWARVWQEARNGHNPTPRELARMKRVPKSTAKLPTGTPLRCICGGAFGGPYGGTAYKVRDSKGEEVYRHAQCIGKEQAA